MRFLPIVAMWVTSTLAIVGAEKKIAWLHVVFKPLTTLLLLAVVGYPQTTFARWVAAGIALSVVGDVALLWDSNRAFIVGLAAFLLAHVAYVIAFVGRRGLVTARRGRRRGRARGRRCCCCARSGRAPPGCTRPTSSTPS